MPTRFGEMVTNIPISRSSPLTMNTIDSSSIQRNSIGLWETTRNLPLMSSFYDRNVVHELREALLTGFAYTDIGIACNCDNEWGQVCIIEIGSDITPSDDYADFFDDADSSFFPILPA